ncbi:carbohydrate-binding protein [Streptomyces sp. NPDC051940]|uniref:carbohydrate-binding protein n=1 Tax=Streptomyces sp. NPDC051940 TaxID=3155675 RepID=UPI0034495527
MSFRVNVRRPLRALTAAAVAAATAGLLAVTAPGAQAAPTRYEAENATISQGLVEANHTGYSGTGFVNGDNVTGSYVQFTVSSTTAGTATLALRYANGTTTDRPMDIAVNGTVVAAGVSFPSTGTWDTWATKTLTAQVTAGSNTVRATATTVNGGPNLDYLDVTAPTASSDYQAEDATVSQGLVESNHTGFTGTGFVNYDNVTGSYVEFTVNAAAAGDYGLQLRYANGTTTDRPMNVTVNGVSVASGASFPGTGTWDTWATKTVNATLNAGANTVRATATTANGGPNLDRLTLGSPDTGPGTPGMAVAPYEYLGWGSPPDPVSVMNATGVKWFTLAFILSDGTCNPAWDGSRPLTGGNDQAKINAIRQAGGDVIISFGGWSGTKLGEKCTSASALAGAYQKVINAYGLKVVDIDIENTEWENATVRQRVIDALKTVKQNNPGIKTVITFGTTTSGPDSTGVDMINRGAASGLANDIWCIMPFDFGGGSTNMGTLTTQAMEGLKARVKAAYGYSDTATYARIGLSSMNGKTDVAGELVRIQDFQTMLAYAQQHHIARLTYWSVNRDRACAGGSDADSCSGVSQAPYDYLKVLVQYTG